MQIKLNKFQELTMSYWLKARISEISSRDVVDMLNDTLWLAELLKGLVDEASKERVSAYPEWIGEDSNYLE